MLHNSNLVKTKLVLDVITAMMPANVAFLVHKFLIGKTART
jgi:hypothetical protein